MLSFYSENVENTENGSSFPFIFLFILFWFLTIFPYNFWMLDVNMHRKYGKAAREHFIFLSITIKAMCRVPTAVLGEGVGQWGTGNGEVQWYWIGRAKGKAGVGWPARPASSLSEQITFFDIPREDKIRLSSKAKNKDRG